MRIFPSIVVRSRPSKSWGVAATLWLIGLVLFGLPVRSWSQDLPVCRTTIEAEGYTAKLMAFETPYFSEYSATQTCIREIYMSVRMPILEETYASPDADGHTASFTYHRRDPGGEPSFQLTIRGGTRNAPLPGLPGGTSLECIFEASGIEPIWDATSYQADDPPGRSCSVLVERLRAITGSSIRATIRNRETEEIVYRADLQIGLPTEFVQRVGVAQKKLWEDFQNGQCVSIAAQHGRGC